MSDYYNNFGPLFVATEAKPKVVGRVARMHHERVTAQADALSRLRSGERMTDSQWKVLYPGSRLPPVVDKLRNAHGFRIDGTGSEGSPYFMPDRQQLPGLVATSEAMKEAYWSSSHWSETRQRRFAMDSFVCVACQSCDDLICHHFFYDLFNEEMRHLVTLCDACHEIAHTQSRLSFPSGMKVEHARRLGFDVQFDSWLLPGGSCYGH